MQNSTGIKDTHDKVFSSESALVFSNSQVFGATNASLLILKEAISLLYSFSSGVRRLPLFFLQVV
jgi:hypothetical protein